MLAKYLAAPALLIAMGSGASAQEADAFPEIETLALEASFAVDPRTLTVFSGGAVNAADQVQGCAGYISEQPNVRLTYTADPTPAALPLFIHALSEGDTTLVIRAPDSNWYCNDDGINGMNPMIVFGPAMSGEYEIWLGSYEPDANHEVILAFTELGPDLAPLETVLNNNTNDDDQGR